MEGLRVAARAGALVAGLIVALSLQLPTAAASTTLAVTPPLREVILDPTTGTVVAVFALGLPEISIADGCDTGWACYQTNQPGYTDHGFYGSSGTYHGDWPYRSGFYTGDYSAYACWTGKCSGTYPPGTYVGFTSDVTGTAFWIS